jgi:hypothetical protein
VRRPWRFPDDELTWNPLVLFSGDLAKTLGSLHNRSRYHSTRRVESGNDDHFSLKLEKQGFTPIQKWRMH